LHRIEQNGISGALSSGTKNFKHVGHWISATRSWLPSGNFSAEAETEGRKTKYALRTSV
jgi:hypothetical protein